MGMNEVKDETHACEYKLTNGEARQVETVQLRRRPPLDSHHEGLRIIQVVYFIAVRILSAKSVSSCY